MKNMDGIYTGSLSLEPGFYEYVHALSGPADGNSGWGIIGYAPDDCALGTNPKMEMMRPIITLTLNVVKSLICQPFVLVNVQSVLVVA